MVVIRLARFGAKHNPQYRIAVADSRRWVKGRFIEILGSYNPSASDKTKAITIDLGRVQQWTDKGAQLSERVKRLVRQVQAAN